uniref:Putative transcription factor H2A superfamily protein n=1 Tax=Linum usitatissimum TaxID=4006 RepID=F6LC73_LINUS|nr:putative transcription factor H2A superfamily protein [Linum usitatissimum]
MPRPQDEYIPLATITRVMRSILPPRTKISEEVKETIQKAVSEYISIVTVEANEHCRHDQRRTVTAEDVLWAMDRLGFDNYVETLSLYLTRYRESEGHPSAPSRDPNPTPPLNPTAQHHEDFRPTPLMPPSPLALTLALTLAPPLQQQGPNSNFQMHQGDPLLLRLGLGQGNGSGGGGEDIGGSTSDQNGAQL